MRLELVCALVVIAVVTIGISAEDSRNQNDVDDERSARDALDGDDGQSVLGYDDGRRVRDASLCDRERCHRCRRVKHRPCFRECRGC